MKKIFLILICALLGHRFAFSQCTLSASISASGPVSFCRGDSVVLTAITSGGNGGVSTLDQSQYVYNGGTSARNLPGYSIMQSFTAGLTGMLDKIDMGFFNYINGVGAFNIYNGTGDGGTLLQTQSVSVYCPSGNCLIPFNVNAQVTAGQVYTFDFIPGAGIPDPYGVQVEVPGTYAGGQMIIKDPSGSYFPGFDIVFATYVASSGGGTLHYQWQRNGVALSSDTGSSLTVKDSSGNYSIYVTDGGGCADTSNLIQVTINEPAFHSFGAVICNGSEFNFNGRIYDTTGIYNDTLTAGTGCDSIVSLSLFVQQANFSTITASICPGSTYPFKGANLSEPGNYEDTLSNVNGCDSIVQLQLSLISIPVTDLHDSICNGSTYNFGGQTIDAGGNYYDTLPSSSGCDSIIRLQLSVISNPSAILYDSICKGDNYYFGGQTLFGAGTYYDTLSTSSGCDSLVTLNLSVRAKPQAVITRHGSDTLSTTAFATYQWLLNGAPVNGAEGQTYIALENGAFSVVVSDGSGCNDTSAPVNIFNLSVNSISSNAGILLYPNPTNGLLNIQTSGTGKLLSLNIFNEYGTLVSAFNINAINNNYSTSLSLESYAAGIYFLRFQFDDFDVIKRIEVLK